MIDILIGEPPKKNIRRIPDCLKCEHFSITWDANFPRSCVIFDIKTRRIPSADVLDATGKQCPAFKQKADLA